MSLPTMRIHTVKSTGINKETGAGGGGKGGHPFFVSITDAYTNLFEDEITLGR